MAEGTAGEGKAAQIYESGRRALLVIVLVRFRLALMPEAEGFEFDIWLSSALPVSMALALIRIGVNEYQVLFPLFSVKRSLSKAIAVSRRR